jgi:hypothetical protein
MHKLLQVVLWLPKYIFLAHYVIFVNFSMPRAKYLVHGESRIASMQKRLFPS